MNQNNVPEGWEEKSLGSIAKRIISGSTPSTSNPRYWNGEIVWVTPDDLSQNERMYMNGSSRRITSKGLSHSSAKLIPKKSIVMSSRAPIGYVAIMNVEYTTNQGCKSLELKDVVPEFVYYSLIFNMPKIKQQGEGTTFAEISKTQLEKVSLILPKSSNEQRKIADVLQTIDRTIQKTKELIEKYRKIRHGLMQDLFVRGVNQKGKPHLEYKESKLGEIPKEWDVVELERYLDKLIDYRGKTPEKSENGVPLITAKNVRMGFIDDDPREFIKESNYFKWMTRGYPKKGDILFTTEAPLGNVAELTIEKIALAQRIIALRGNDRLKNRYLKYALMHDKIRAQFISISTGSTVTGIKQSQLRKLKIYLPSPDEQIRIAEILEAIDRKIESEEAYLSEVIEIKTGLMQDLLTGRVKVPA